MLIWLVTFFSLAFTLLPDSSSQEYTVSSVAAVAAHIEQARAVELTAYVLSRRGRMSNALLRAAARGAHVHVVLDGVAYGSVARSNRLTSQYLRTHGIQVDLTDYQLHAKVALVDRSAYLTDRNWASRGQSELVILDTNPQDLPLISNVIQGQSGSNDHFSTRKADALRLEAALISNRSSDIALETEAYTAGSIIETSLLQQAQRGAHIRLLVDQQELRHSPKEQRALERLAQAGIQIRVGPLSEKLAIAGNQAWIGSANATPGVPNQIDWGLDVPPTLVARIQNQFEHNWQNAMPWDR